MPVAGPSNMNRRDDDDDDSDRKPVNKTEQARKQAKQVIEFEKKIAKASLDL